MSINVICLFAIPSYYWIFIAWKLYNESMIKTIHVLEKNNLLQLPKNAFIWNKCKKIKGKTDERFEPAPTDC